MSKKIFILTTIFFTAASVFSQDFGFGDETDTEFSGFDSAGSALTVDIGGEVKASLTGFVGDFYDGADAVRLGDIFSGKLNFSAENSRAKGVINLKVDTAKPPDELRDVFDEAYLRAYFGKADIEAGLRKLTWGKADNMGPLDVINPLDYSDLTKISDALSDFLTLKIARPLIHASYSLGQFSKLEGVFVPNFEPMRSAASGRWVDAQAARLSAFARPDTSTFNYAQGGLRFTTTIAGSADIGAQYYYGRLSKPAANIAAGSIDYNPYHQIGVDWAQVLFGFNLRAELAVNITEDLGGDDPAVYNPSLAWSLGFDREIGWGITLNLQCNEAIRLLDGQISNVSDIEMTSDVTATQVIASLSKKFLQDELEVKAAVLWEPEERDFLVMPSLIWIRDDVSVELSGGIFGGDEDGQFGQYRNNGFVKAAVKYTF